MELDRRENSMYMTPGEICREYNQAKNKREQIVILADQNCCNKEEIMKILIMNGEPLPAGKPQKGTAKLKEAKPEEITPKEEKAENGAQVKPQSIPNMVVEALIARLEEIDTLIVKLEKEYKEIAAVIGSRTEEAEK